MAANNINFNHSPLWLEVWGLPLGMMLEKTGRDIGNSMGNFLMADSRSWSLDQEKFVRIRVDIPLNKPLKRCGVKASPEGEIYLSLFLI
ncbi:hypothetical protein ACB092_05G156700 [Castanea dentata]